MSKKKAFIIGMIVPAIVTIIVLIIAFFTSARLVEATWTEEVLKWIVMGMYIIVIIEVIMYVPVSVFVHWLYEKKNK